MMSGRIFTDRSTSRISINESMESEVRRSKLVGFSHMTDRPDRPRRSNPLEGPLSDR